MFIVYIENQITPFHLQVFLVANKNNRHPGVSNQVGNLVVQHLQCVKIIASSKGNTCTTSKLF